MESSLMTNEKKSCGNVETGSTFLERTLPKILNMPEKMLSIIDRFNFFRYFLLEGGRGGGKSQGVARFLLYLCEKKTNLRIVCGREVQKSIEESVYTIFKDLIIEHNLNYKIFANKIVHRVSGSTILFKGFREQGSVNIKGLEGVDILWIDEAQSITKHTLDIIIPTIRKENAKVFFTMNRYLFSDAVYKQFYSREDCFHLYINYFDNPFCSAALRKEAEVCKTDMADDYDHIWLGKPREDVDNYVFSEQVLDACATLDFIACGYYEVAMGVDIARYGGDRSVATIIQRRGPLKWQIKHIERWSKKDLMESTGRIVDLMARFKPSSTSIDADGMGAGVVDRLTELNVDVNEFRGGTVEAIQQDKLYCNLKTEVFCDLQQLCAKGDIEINDKRMVESLLTVMYTHKSNGKKIIISKEQMKGKGLKSPDDAESLMMALHATRFIDQKADKHEQYRSPFHKVVPQEQNLFKMAGFR